MNTAKFTAPPIVRVTCHQCNGRGSVVIPHPDGLPVLETCTACAGRGAINVEKQ